MLKTFKPSIMPYLTKTFVMLFVVMVVVRYVEQSLFGDAAMATYKVMVALPVVVTLLVWLAERTSIGEIEVAEEGLKVTARSGDSCAVPWGSVTVAKHNRPKRFFSHPLWEFHNKAGEKLYIPSGILRRQEEEELTTLITGYLPAQKVETAN